MILAISISPNASKNEIVEWKNNVLRIKIAAPPVNGKANKELLSFLAEILGLPPSSLAIKTGQTSKKKLIGVPLDEKICLARLVPRIKKPTLF